MNARRDHFVKPSPRLAMTSRLLACVGVAALVNGCAGGPFNPFTSPPVDSASPIADEVATAARSNRGYPAFSDIPNAPAEQRSARAWGEAAADVEAAGERLARETAPETWSLGDTQAFVDKAEARVEGDGAPAGGDDTESFARSARQRATPPPSPR